MKNLDTRQADEKRVYRAIARSRALTDYGFTRGGFPFTSERVAHARHMFEAAHPAWQTRLVPLLERSTTSLNRAWFSMYTGVVVVAFCTLVGVVAGLSAMPADLAAPAFIGGVAAGTGVGLLTLSGLWALTGTPQDHADMAAWWAHELLEDLTTPKKTR